MTELERQARHQAWVQWNRSLDKDKGASPAPGYKDCFNCTFREEYETPDERQDFCVTQCPFLAANPTLPTTPPVAHLLAELWADLPDVFLEKYATVIGLRMCLEVSKIKKYREDKRMADLMGVRLLG